MADNYDELKRRIQLLVDRDDIEDQVAEDNTSVNMLDIFIAAAERRFYRSEAAKIPPFERIVTYPGVSGTGIRELVIPAGYVEMRYALARHSDGGEQHTLARVSPEQILDRNVSIANTDIPRSIAYSSGRWVVPHSYRETIIDVIFYGTLDALSTQTMSTNNHWLLNRGDDLITYWAAVEAALYFDGMNDMVAKWEERAKISHDQIVEQEIRQESSGTTPRQNRPYRSTRSRRFGFHF